MRALIKNEIGREVNPHWNAPLDEDDPENIYDAVSSLRWQQFEKSVKEYPAPGIIDGEHEVGIKWQFQCEDGSWLNATEDTGNYTYEDYERILGGMDIPTRQILVKQEGEEKPETIKSLVDDCVATETQTQELLKRIAELEGALPKWISVEEQKPEEGAKVWGALQHWEGKNYRYYEIKKVNESDCEWRTVDDNSEISYDWTVTHWMPLPPAPIITKALKGEGK